MNDFDIPIGSVLKVGVDHMWIDTAFGYTDDAYHGNCTKDIDDPGSIDRRCSVMVLSKPVNGNVDVVLLRDYTPYGAQAATGTLFTLPVETILSWRPKKMPAPRAEHYRHIVTRCSEKEAGL